MVQDSQLVDLSGKIVKCMITNIDFKLSCYYIRGVGKILDATSGLNAHSLPWLIRMYVIKLSGGYRTNDG